MPKVRELALFAGAGGGIYASILLGHRVVCAVEKDDYRRRVLAQRVADGIFPAEMEIHEDIREFDGRPWRGRVDLVSGGFPCVAFSVAGKGLAGKDPRNLWPETARVLCEVRPRFAFLENVPGLLGKHGYFGTVLGDLAEIGFDAEWMRLGASDVGAPHRRHRIFILAYLPDPDRGERSEQSLAYADGERREGLDPLLLQGRSHEDRAEAAGSDLARMGPEGPWARDPAEEPPDSESFVGRVAHGVADRSKQLGALEMASFLSWRRLHSGFSGSAQD